VKKTVLFALVLALPVLTMAAPDLSGTFKMAPQAAKSEGRHAPIAVIVIEHKGDKLSLKENSEAGYLIQGYECTIGGKCDNIAARSRTKFPGQARWEGNDLVLISEALGEPRVIRRYSLSADKKMLLLKEQDARPVNTEFYRE
jgi:hypothetical protein